MTTFNEIFKSEVDVVIELKKNAEASNNTELVQLCNSFMELGTVIDDLSNAAAKANIVNIKKLTTEPFNQLKTKLKTLTARMKKETFSEDLHTLETQMMSCLKKLEEKSTLEKIIQKDTPLRNTVLSQGPSYVTKYTQPSINVLTTRKEIYYDTLEELSRIPSVNMEELAKLSMEKLIELLTINNSDLKKLFALSDKLSDIQNEKRDDDLYLLCTTKAKNKISTRIIEEQEKKEQIILQISSSYQKELEELLHKNKNMLDSMQSSIETAEKIIAEITSLLQENNPEKLAQIQEKIESLKASIPLLEEHSPALQKAKLAIDQKRQDITQQIPETETSLRKDVEKSLLNLPEYTSIKQSIERANKIKSQSTEISLQYEKFKISCETLPLEEIKENLSKKALKTKIEILTKEIEDFNQDLKTNEMLIKLYDEKQENSIKKIAGLNNEIKLIKNSNKKPTQATVDALKTLDIKIDDEFYLQGTYAKEQSIAQKAINSLPTQINSVQLQINNLQHEEEENLKKIKHSLAQHITLLNTEIQCVEKALNDRPKNGVALNNTLKDELNADNSQSLSNLSKQIASLETTSNTIHQIVSDNKDYLDSASNAGSNEVVIKIASIKDNHEKQSAALITRCKNKTTEHDNLINRLTAVLKEAVQGKQKLDTQAQIYQNKAVEAQEAMQLIQKYNDNGPNNAELNANLRALALRLFSFSEAHKQFEIHAKRSQDILKDRATTRLVRNYLEAPDTQSKKQKMKAIINQSMPSEIDKALKALKKETTRDNTNERRYHRDAIETARNEIRQAFYEKQRTTHRNRYIFVGLSGLLVIPLLFTIPWLIITRRKEKNEQIREVETSQDEINTFNIPNAAELLKTLFRKKTEHSLKRAPLTENQAAGSDAPLANNQRTLKLLLSTQEANSFDKIREEARKTNGEGARKASEPENIADLSRQQQQP